MEVMRESQKVQGVVREFELDPPPYRLGKLKKKKSRKQKERRRRDGRRNRNQSSVLPAAMSDKVTVM